MNSRSSGLLLTTVAFAVFAGCSTKYAVPPAGSGDYEYRLAAASGGAGQDTTLTVTCWRKLVPRDSLLEYHRRLSTAGWASAIGASVLLCGSGALGWSQGWTALGQYSLGLGIALPVAAPLLAHAHGRTRPPKRLTNFHPAVGESLIVENLTASRSCTYVTGTSGKVALSANIIKDWLAGRNDVSLWVAPRSERGTRLGINVTSTGTVREVGLEDMSFETAESLSTVKAYSDFLRDFPASVRATEARKAIELLAWKAACAQNTRESYQVFTRTYPQSESTAGAPARIERAVLDSTEAVNTAEAYEAFIRAFPSSPLVVNAKRDIEKLTWDKVAAQNTVAACDSYIRTHLNGEFVQEARNLRQSIEAEAKAEREARIEAERQAAEERRREEPLSTDAAIRQWKHFRTDEQASDGTITTWRFKVNYTGVAHDMLGGSCSYMFGYLGYYAYPVRVMGYCQASKDDWVVVTGRFDYVNSDGEVVLNLVKLKNEGYKD